MYFNDHLGVKNVPRTAAVISSRSHNSRSRRYCMKNIIFKICQKKSQSKEKNKQNILKLESKKMGSFQMYEKS